MILAFVRMTTTDDFTVILNLIQDRLKMILAFVRMTTTDDFTVIPEFNSGQALNLIQNVILNLIQDLLKNDSCFRGNDKELWE